MNKELSKSCLIYSQHIEWHNAHPDEPELLWPWPEKFFVVIVSPENKAWLITVLVAAARTYNVIYYANRPMNSGELYHHRSIDL